ncbi:MAG: tetratricopeptide repeat protein [Planctomycetota bacterium]
MKSARSAHDAPPLSARGAWFAPWILVACTLAVYANCFAVPFLFDDVPSIVDNPQIRQLWPIWELFVFEGDRDLGIAGRPAANVSFALNYALGGLNVVGYHAVNVAVHVAAGLLLFGLVRRTLRLAYFERRFDGSETALAFAVALVWVVHPLQTKAVTFIVQRLESMAAAFYLALLYALARRATGGGARWSLVAFLACVLGMATKESFASAPIAAFLFDAIFVAGGFKAAWRARGALHGLLASTWILLYVLIASTPRMKLAADATAQLSSFAYMKMQAWAIVHYVQLSVWPSPLVFDYGVAGEGVPLRSSPGEYLPYAIPVVLLVLASVWGVIRRKAWGFLGAVFFLVLAPSSSLVPIPNDVVTEHRMYLPLASIVVLVLVGSAYWVRRARGLAFLAAGLALALPLGIAAHARNRDYQSELTIWADTVEKLPRSARAQMKYGLLLFERDDLDGAIEHYRAAIRIRPLHYEAHHNLATALMRKSRWKEAVDEYRAALADPNPQWESHHGLGEALMQLNQLEPAAAQFERVIERKPEVASAYARLGAIRQVQGKLDEAARLYTQALQREPNDAVVLNYLGIVCATQGKVDEAGRHFRRALGVQPGFEDARRNLEKLRVTAK